MHLTYVCKLLASQRALFRTDIGEQLYIPLEQLYNLINFIQPGDSGTITQKSNKHKFVLDSEIVESSDVKRKRGRPKSNNKKKYIPTGRPRGRPKKMKLLTFQKEINE